MSWERIVRARKGALHPEFAAIGLLALARLCAAGPNPESSTTHQVWQPVGLSGGGGMFAPAISSADRNLMMINCDMSGAYLSEDGGHNWRMLNQAQLRSDTRCRPAFHPVEPNIIYASSAGRLRVSRDRGRTFAPVGNLNEALQGEIAINATAPDVLLLGTWNGRCW